MAPLQADDMRGMAPVHTVLVPRPPRPTATIGDGLSNFLDVLELLLPAFFQFSRKFALHRLVAIADSRCAKCWARIPSFLLLCSSRRSP